MIIDMNNIVEEALKHLAHNTGSIAIVFKNNKEVDYFIEMIREKCKVFLFVLTRAKISTRKSDIFIYTEYSDISDLRGMRFEKSLVQYNVDLSNKIQEYLRVCTINKENKMSIVDQCVEFLLNGKGEAACVVDHREDIKTTMTDVRTKMYFDLRQYSYQMDNKYFRSNETFISFYTKNEFPAFDSTKFDLVIRSESIKPDSIKLPIENVDYVKVTHVGYTHFIPCLYWIDIQHLKLRGKPAFITEYSDYTVDNANSSVVKSRFGLIEFAEIKLNVIMEVILK